MLTEQNLVLSNHNWEIEQGCLGFEELHSRMEILILKQFSYEKSFACLVMKIMTRLRVASLVT